jgi:hypothetical protein
MTQLIGHANTRDADSYLLFCARLLPSMSTNPSSGRPATHVEKLRQCHLMRLTQASVGYDQVQSANCAPTSLNVVQPFVMRLHRGCLELSENQLE